MKSLAEFVSQHLSDDTSRLILDRKKWPDTDMELAVNCIESRRKLKGKVQEWYDNPDLVFPLKLSAEQCSSSATGHYKAALADRIAKAENQEDRRWKLADLTGGLGVDSWFFSMKADKVLYNEMQEALCQAAEYNFKILDASGIQISNKCAAPGNINELLKDFHPDIVFMDPARRSSDGRKVFLIEDCMPDVLKIQDEIFEESRHILLKLSPMADITMACDRLGSHCREVHVVASGGECKELLIWMDREWNEEYTIHAVELPSGYPDSEASMFSFHPSEEKDSAIEKLSSLNTAGCSDVFLFEPGKALMKAGCFNLIGNRYGIAKLGKSTHFYTLSDKECMSSLCRLGKIFRIIRCEPLDKRTVKAAGKDFPKSEVTARNIPMDTETLRKKTGVTSGDDAHIFGLKSDVCGNMLLCTKRVFEKDLKTH